MAIGRAPVKVERLSIKEQIKKVKDNISSEIIFDGQYMINEFMDEASHKIMLADFEEIFSLTQLTKLDISNLNKETNR